MSFDHRAAGPPAAAWDALLAGVPRADLPAGVRHLVVLAAHPDDETLGAGGLVAAAAAGDVRVSVLVASDGEASHPDSPTHSPGRLAQRRRDEVRAAVAALAPQARVELLGLPDGRLAEHDAGLVTALAAAAALTNGGALLAAPWGGDRHPDHEACARAARHVAARLGATLWHYPIWAWHWDDPTDAVLGRQRLLALELPVPVQAAKQRALACHVSQHTALSAATGDEAILPASVQAAAGRPVEVFVVAPEGTDTPSGYFAELYAAADDPWGLDSRWYERRKRDVLLAALPRPRFRHAFEPGCATGALTAALADRCDAVTAWDPVPAAVAATTTRQLPGTLVEQRGIPDDWPPGPFDLVVLSEVGYYCADLGLLAARVGATLATDGVLVGCHWRHPAATHVHTAEEVHHALSAGLHTVAEHVEVDFVLQVWTRTGISVAAATGIVS